MPDFPIQFCWLYNPITQVERVLAIDVYRYDSGNPRQVCVSLLEKGKYIEGQAVSLADDEADESRVNKIRSMKDEFDAIVEREKAKGYEVRPSPTP